MKRNIYWQAGLALVTVVLTVVIVFTMTSAWYTNIVQTSGLVFQAESWGFDGSVKVLSNSVVAAPGDEGVIGLEVENTNDSMAAVSVSVSKAGISADNETKQQMQQRLYFYIDTQMTRNGETMDRVYLNSQESYTYTLFNQGKLVLTDQIHNDVYLKWQWVYDVLGYYVLGTYSRETDVAVLEYLRPIEYDYDEATTTFDGRFMTLQTVDGTMTVDEFLVELSKTDGYEGQIDPKQKTGMGFYPVDVDEETGYGVYAYLCSFSEIEQATAYDTRIAAAAAQAIAEGKAPEAYEIQLNIAAQKNDETVINVATMEALQAAIDMDLSHTIQLSSPITIPADQKLVIPAGSKMMLDLNGYAINSRATERSIEAQPGSSLTVVNGSITGPGEGHGIYTAGAEVVCNNVSISGYDYAVYVGDRQKDAEGKTNALDSRVRLVNCELSASSVTLFVSGNGETSAQKTQLLIDGCKISGDSYALSGNGTYWGTDIQIMNSELISDPAGVSTAIYHPQKNSTLTIYNSKVSGYTGIALKGGTITVSGSEIAGLGAVADDYEPSFSGSGFSDTGAGIYIETNYDWPVVLVIDSASLTDQNGETYLKASFITSQHGEPLQVFEPDAEDVTVTIVSGLFNGEAVVPEGYELAQASDGSYIIRAKKESQ